LGLLLSLLGLLGAAFIGITIGILLGVDTLAICGFVVTVLLVIGAPPPFLLVVGLGLIPVLFGKFLGHPGWEFIFVPLLALLALLVLPFTMVALTLVVIVGLPFFLSCSIVASRAMI